ncbi:protein mono-ADP-ribosyltransferase PARP12 [Aplochiton taeniatus]
MTESTIAKIICANNGSINIDELATFVTIDSQCDLVRTITSNTAKFHVGLINGEKKVVAKTSLRLCKKKDCPGCRNLHFCKRFLFGDCPFGRGRRVCYFSHDLTSEENARALRQHGLEDLHKSELCTLLLQNDSYLLPPVCHSYNNGIGEYGKCPDGPNCRRLHICEMYLRGTCDCTRAHDFYEPHPLKALQDRGVPSNLLSSMKYVYMNIEALRSHDQPNKGKRGHQPNDTNANAGHSANQRPTRGAVQTKEKTEICMYFIKGNCIHGDKCFKEHSTLPYKWEMKEGKQWTALPNNEEIEEDYCDPKKTYSRGGQPVCFDTMTCGLFKARRLSTISAVLQPNFVLTTEWAWYWEDEFGKWNQYATFTGTQKVASITSSELEESFQNDKKATVDFTAGSQSYEISFLDMIQTNKSYQTKKVVRRRPVFVSAAEAQTLKTSRRAPVSGGKALPGHWDKSQTPETGYKRVALQSSSVEYKEIEGLFRTTMRGFDIQQIERIQNKALWEVFQWQKDFMKKNNAGRNVVEKKLFHGTDMKYIDAISHNNFDWRICGINGTAYGKGSYFARDAKYSHSYTGQSNVKSMFVCRVLVGDYITGHSSYLRPPSKDGGDTNFYDSCVDNLSNPSIFVVFEKPQVYPEYLIQYKEEVPFHSTTWTPAPAPQPKICNCPSHLSPDLQLICKFLCK